MKTSRREFLKISALAGGGLMIGFNLFNPTEAKGKEAKLLEINAFIKISTDGKIVLMSKNPEIGQGVKTSMPMILAEELEVDWQQISVEQASLDNRLGAQFAGGSQSINTNFENLRKAGATAKLMLMMAAAAQWNEKIENCTVEKGVISLKNSDKKLKYSEVAESAVKIMPPKDVKLKPPQDFKIIGTFQSGVDNPKIVTGQPLFGIDWRVPDMLFASIIKPPTFGAKVVSFDDSEARKVEGVKQIIKIEPLDNPTQLIAGVAVVATSTWIALKAKKLVKVTWDNGLDKTENSASLTEQFSKLTSKNAEIIVKEQGNVDEVFADQNAQTIEAVYEVPFLAHATMEPMNCTAHVKPDSCEIWGPTQTPATAQQLAAKMTGLTPDKIKVHMTRIGGGFGRRLMADFAGDAVYVSKAVGAPVQVIWSREDDMQYDYYRPAGMYRMRGSVDQKGKITAWSINAATVSRPKFSGSNQSPHTTEVFPDGFPAGLIPHFRMQYSPARSNVPVGAWRTPGHNATAFVDQCFLDELAFLAKKDPLDIRLELLGTARPIPYRDHGSPLYDTGKLKNVLLLAAEKANWRQPAPKGIYRGIAGHYTFGSYVAEVAEVSVQDGKIKIERVVAAVDCGLVVNQSGAANQIEGGIIDGLSAMFYGEITIENGAVKQRNFNDYPLIRMKDTPKIEVYFVESQEKPQGLGEVSLPPIAPAVANAIFAATGKRIRKLPLVREEGLKI